MRRAWPQAIRQVAPLHTIIASGANNSDIPDLLALEPLADGNVIYNFHFYEPHDFTHQGANWGEPWWKYTHSIPYPPTESSMQEALKEVPDAVDRYQLENYFLDGWDAHHIRLLIDEAAAWGREKNVPLICNEFGAYREYSDPNSRANWIHDVRTALEADGIGWAMWDYRGGFGVVTKEDGKPAQVDDLVVKALGLKENRASGTSAAPTGWNQPGFLLRLKSGRREQAKELALRALVVLIPCDHADVVGGEQARKGRNWVRAIEVVDLQSSKIGNCQKFV